jgi:hypothetical protein
MEALPCRNETILHELLLGVPLLRDRKKRSSF